MIRQYPLSTVRNIGILAHIDAGKTTTTERILYYSGLTHKLGEVHDGTAVMDWMAQEQERGITITSAATTFSWKSAHINLIDTPGHVDFTVEVERCLRILDGAVFVLDAKEGVEAQTEAVWRKANHYDVPRIVYINKMDIIGADFHRGIDMLKDRLQAKAVPIQLPIGSEREFIGIISLIDMKAYYNSGQLGEIVEVKEIPSDYIEQAHAYRKHLIETLSDCNEDMMNAYLNDQPISAELISTTLRKATLEECTVPVLCGSAYKNKGIQLLLDAIVDFLPSPLDRPYINGQNLKGESIKRRSEDQESFSALLFKVASDPYVGKLNYLRVYSGTLETGDILLNATKNKKERVNKLLLMHANSRTEVTTAATGDIVASVGLKYTTTGDTLCDLNEPILYETMDFPEPVMSIAVELLTPSDADKMNHALERLTEEDPTLRVMTDPETGQTLLYGMGELHLDIILDRMSKEFGVSVNSGKPQVTYKETVTHPATVTYTLDKQSENHTLYAMVRLSIYPKERGTGSSVEVSIPNDLLSQHYRESCIEGINQALQSGILGGYEVVDVHVTLEDAASHHDQTSDIAFKAAASQALYEALRQGESTLLEPFFTVVVHVPQQSTGEVVDDFNRRRGIITSIEAFNDDQIVQATVPLTQLFGYATSLRSKTKGRGQHTMLFSHFDVN